MKGFGFFIISLPQTLVVNLLADPQGRGNILDCLLIPFGNSLRLLCLQIVTLALITALLNIRLSALQFIQFILQAV
ncbi:hypothetical protein ACTL6P_13070 [Endozoicomonas acroporae]|uniref:hypothetical protein n=1 Tax=Endozoicomonas acroporae TaxID=1701104 RepID=UPI003F892F0D